MAIQWFPGHMMKSMRTMQDNVGLVDCILYVLDARIPSSCINPYFSETIEGKPIVYLLNKADLADPAETEQWVRKLSRGGNRALALSATGNRAVGDVVKAIAGLDLKKVRSRAEKGFDYKPRAMVIGVPNTGKSTVINMLCGKAKTVTGDKAGVTRGIQWVTVDKTVDLLDTPGTLPQKINDDHAAAHLAMVGSVKEEVVDLADLAFRLVSELQATVPGCLSARYGIDEQGAPPALMEEIARVRGFLMKRGEYDYDRTASAILDDFRKGRMGRITLEKASCWTTNKTTSAAD